MDWSNERYVRLFTRDTPEWLCWSWQARALWPLLIRKVDRSGVLANKLGVRGVAALVGLPVEVVDAGLPDLLSDGCLKKHPLGYVVPNFIEAQETPQSDKQRKRDSRERRRAIVTLGHDESQNVTTGHDESREVTTGHSGPDQTVPSPEEHKKTPARDPTVPPVPPVPPVLPVLPVPHTMAVLPTTVQPVPCTPAAQELSERRRVLIWRCWGMAGEAFARVQASGIDATAPNGWSGLPDPGSPPMKNLREIVDGMLIGESPDFARVEAKIANRIAVAEAKARAMSPPTTRYMTPSGIWNREWFAIDVDLSPAQVSSPRPEVRAGPGSRQQSHHHRQPEAPRKTTLL